MSMPLLELKQVNRSFPTPGGTLEVLTELDLVVEAGESLAIVGPSGSGKSTLLNLLGGLDRPTTGAVVFEGHDLRDLDDEALARMRSRRVGFVFQDHHLLPQCTLRENVLLPTLAHPDPPPWKERQARADALLERVGLADRAGHRPGELSGGECQRTAVARALINQPGLLLADEPTGALDTATGDRVADLLTEINQADGVTLVVVTHSMALADRMARRLELGR